MRNIHFKYLLMKKLFLLFATTACLLSTQAQVSNVWTDQSLELPRAVTEASGNDMIAVAVDNSVYATGLFTQPFSFGTSDLEPIATSTYLAKYDAAGNKKWAVAFAGAATPTAITVAEDGSIYVAGTLADEVIFNSTDGATVIKEGVKNSEGIFFADQKAAFIAQYDANGVLKQVKTYLPTNLTSANPEIYDPNVGLVINEIKATSTGIFASFIVRGVITDNGITLKGTYSNLFDFLLEDIATGHVVRLQPDLQFSQVLASLGAPENELFQYKVYRSIFTIDNNILYVAFETVGNQTLSAGASNIDFTFTNNGEDFARGYIVASVDVSSTPTILSSKKYENTPVDYYLIQTVFIDINAVNIVNGDLVVTGYFGKDLAFDNAVVATDDADLFVAVLNTSDLSVKSATSSAQAGTEIATSTAIIGDNVFISAIVDKSSILYTLNLSDKSTKVSVVPGYLNGIAANGEDLASINALVEGETAKLVVKLDKYSIGQGIGNNTNDEIGVNVYPNPVADELFFSESCDVDVYSILGSLVLSKKNTESVDVRTLANGSYLAVITTANGKQTTHFIKK